MPDQSADPAASGNSASEHESGPAWSRDRLSRDPHADAEKAARVQAMFTSIAHAYDLNNRLHSFGMDQAWRRATVRAVEPKPTDRVLDVACGTGDLTEAFARRGVAHATGADYTPAMLALARAKLARRRPTLPIEYIEADAQALPFEDANFDIVSIAFGIRNVADTARALREFRRVLAPGGRLAILEFGQPRNALLRWANRAYTERIMPMTASIIARDRSGAYAYLPRSVETYLAPPALAAAVERAGFNRVRQVSMTFGVCVLTVAHAAERHVAT
ncbi:MAG: bifunctional demethylmenaquinone methyltransferase/2-methoxy-6-polyprenyl-1,4-benzoquinol methylase UbiE [Planctomycetota bacterium]|nr:bifunctional demethylmenaquinone methyltransferase/2-methoxy-6-polyprenyl-1,4-benzoquinol methylase UbiE [Planctomycetota bacterium]MDA1105055.1 bifunctional demethylmenaquinone methyltransferase/2-methoxy-6-polyprenyl-1,4-benzoquinol methylase UbiE [Planctomycetota bacterium]